MTEIFPLAGSSELIIPVEGFELHELGLTMVGEVSFEHWSAMGYQLQKLVGAVHWFIGDWLIAGEMRYGESYTQAIEMTGHSMQTLANDKWVCSRIPLDHRRAELTFAHHSEVAKMELPVADAWLSQAVANAWTRDELREAIRGSLPDVQKRAPKIGVPKEQLERFRQALEVLADRDVAAELAAEFPGLRFLQDEQEIAAEAVNAKLYQSALVTEGVNESLSALDLLTGG